MEKERISRLVTEVSDYAKKLRNQFHMNPELSDQGIEQACRYAEADCSKAKISERLRVSGNFNQNAYRTFHS